MNLLDRTRRWQGGAWLVVLMALGIALASGSCKGSDRKRKKLQEYGPPRPTLESLSQDSGQVGGAITLVGSNFDASPPNNIVSFNGQFTTGIGGDTEILVVNVPFGASTGPIWVEVAGRTSNALWFTITGGPQITALNPPSGPSGTLVTIDGINFSPFPEENMVRFQWDGMAGFETAALTSSATRLTCFAPEGADSGSVNVEVGGQFSNTAPYIYTTPTLIDLSPRSGFVGNGVMLCGRNFSLVPAENTVRFNGTVATVVSAQGSTCSSGAIQLAVTVPVGAEAGPVTVEVGGRKTRGIFYCVQTPPPSPPSGVGFSPGSGAWGDAVTITGFNFSGNLMDNEVRFNGILAPVLSTSLNQIGVLVPDLATTGRVTVTRGAETATSAGDLYFNG